MINKDFEEKITAAWPRNSHFGTSGKHSKLRAFPRSSTHSDIDDIGKPAKAIMGNATKLRYVTSTDSEQQVVITFYKQLVQVLV